MKCSIKCARLDFLQLHKSCRGQRFHLSAPGSPVSRLVLLYVGLPWVLIYLQLPKTYQQVDWLLSVNLMSCDGVASHLGCIPASISCPVFLVQNKMNTFLSFFFYLWPCVSWVYYHTVCKQCNAIINSVGECRDICDMMSTNCILVYYFR